MPEPTSIPWPAICSAIAATASALAAIFTAWTNINNRADSVRPELNISSCCVDDKNNITSLIIENIGVGMAIDIDLILVYVDAEEIVRDLRVDIEPTYYLTGILGAIPPKGKMKAGQLVKTKLILGALKIANFELDGKKIDALLDSIDSGGAVYYGFVLSCLDMRGFLHEKFFSLCVDNKDSEEDGYFHDKISDGVQIFYLKFPRYKRTYLSPKKQQRRFINRESLRTLWLQALIREKSIQ